MRWPLRQLVTDPLAVSQSDFAHALMQHIVHGEQLSALATQAGLILLATSEPALDHTTSLLQKSFPGLALGKPQINYVYGDPIMEPFTKIALEVPAGRLSSVLHDLQTRRAQLQSTVTLNGTARVEADIPTSELLGYETALRSICSASVPFEQRFSGYRPAPGVDGAVA